MKENWLDTLSGRIRERADADECDAAVRRQYWMAEARDLLMAAGYIGEPQEDVLEAVAQELWLQTVEMEETS